MRRTTTIPMAILAAMCCSSAMAAGGPLKVYILAGQSNMEGQAKVETFDYIGDDPATAPLLKEMRGPDGKPRVCERVWISYLTGSKDKQRRGARQADGRVRVAAYGGDIAESVTRSARSSPSALPSQRRTTDRS